MLRCVVWCCVLHGVFSCVLSRPRRSLGKVFDKLDWAQMHFIRNVLDGKVCSRFVRFVDFTVIIIETAAAWF